jgi:hypothetical protein
MTRTEYIEYSDFIQNEHDEPSNIFRKEDSSPSYRLNI